ncbi:MAG: SHOCT domain-containing protein [Thermomicrobiales bacterium]|nr:SHOCT domain-containing protein [Thermomicrobiales bacterium]
MFRRGPGRRGPGLVGTVAQTAVIAGTATVVSNKVSGSSAKRASAQQQAQQQAQADAQAKADLQANVQDMQAQLQTLQTQQLQSALPQTPAPAAGGEPDLMARLGQLGEMRTQGLLTEDEFSAAKARLLAG